MTNPSAAERIEESKPASAAMLRRPVRPSNGRLLLGATWVVVRIGLTVYLLVLLLMMGLEERMIFFPSVYPQGDWQPANLKFEDAHFQSADGTPLHGWFVPHDRPRAVALFCHGNAGNLTHRTDRLRNLHQMFQVSVLIFDYRGYGRSQGSPNERGILADARAARQWLAARTGVSEPEIVLLGESLGGAVAVDLAAQDDAAGLVLQSTFASLPETAAYHYPLLPVRWVMRTRLDSISKIARYQGPLLWSHGTADSIIPYEHGQRLFVAAQEPKEAVSLPGWDHNGPPFPEDTAAYREAFDRFLARVQQRLASNQQTAHKDGRP